MSVEVLQGLPGSGKSTYANAQDGAIIVSADSYHMVGGEYRFSPQNIQAAHNQCLRDFLHALQQYAADPEVRIIVDNTNCRAHEAAPYMQLAAVFGRPAKLIYFPCTLEEAVRRNVHGVPFATIAAMHADLHGPHWPAYWARTIWRLS